MSRFEQIKALFPLLNILFLILGSTRGLDECEVSRQRRCRQNLVAEMDKQTRGTDSAKQMELRCRSLEENMNCLVLQVTKCPTPNRSGDLIGRVWKYMQDNCDAFGGWWSYDCFHQEDMKKCEKIFALRDSKASKASCREYDRFRHCIGDVVQKQCDRDDVHSMGNYLLDSAGDMIWTCPHESAPFKSPIVDEGFVGVAKKERDPIGLEQHLSIVPPPLGVTKKAGLGGGGRIAVEESHLRGVYSSALTGEGPYVTGCNARATEEMRGCLDRHQYERDQALGARDDEDRLRKECCATWNYRRCLQNAVRIHCYDTREVDIQSAVDVIPHDRGFLCRNHWIYTCSEATPTTSSVILMTSLLTLIAYVSLIPRTL